jgi:uncharacterized protein
VELTLNLTHACNMGCTYCNAGAKSSRSMSLETGRQGIALALDELEAAGQTRRLDVAFFGGEPFLEFDLLLQLADEATRRAEARDVLCRFAVTTNGTLLTPERADALAGRGFHLALSLDGGAESQDATRRFLGGRSTAQAAWRALDVALPRFSKLSVISVIDPDNVAHLAAGVEQVVEAGVRRLTLNPNWLAGWEPESLATWQRGYERVAELWCERHRLSRPFELNTVDRKIWARLTEDYGPGGGCGFGHLEIAIAPSGRVYPCGRIVGEDPEDASAPGRSLCIGDVEKGLDASACASLPERGTLPEECIACPFQSRCANQCGCSNLEATGDAAIPSGILCWHEKLSIRLADHAASTLYSERNPSFMSTFYSEVCVP